MSEYDKDAKKDPALRRWYGYVKQQPCEGCGTLGTHANPIEAAHLKLVVSKKTGELLPQGHTGEAAWGCIPLCQRCHKLQHEMGRKAFFEMTFRHPAEVWGTLLLRFFHTEDRSPY